MVPLRLFYFALPIIAVVVIVMAYFRLFSSPLVIATLVVLYVIVSYRNKKRFAKRKEGPGVSTGSKG